MKWRFFVLFSFAASVGCFTTHAADSRIDTRVQEYQALKADIVSLHTSSKFSDSDPRVFTARLIDEYPREFIATRCGPHLSQEICTQKLNQDVLSKLSERYFAADMVAVARTCQEEPLICDDLNALETLFRNLHNASVEQSEKEKLSLLDGWRHGKLTDEQLKEALHLNFDFVRGKLRISLPSG